nr:gustatory receptor 27 [Papilio glaucus]
MNLEGISKKIRNCMKPSLVVEYCYGIFRYRINGSPLSPIDRRMKILGIIITMLWIFSINYVCILPKIINIFNEKLNMGKFVREMPWLVCCFHYVASNMLLILWQSENNLKVMETFSNIDVALHASMNNKFYMTSQKECKKMIIMYFIFCITMVISIYGCEEENCIKLFLYLFLYYERNIEIVVLCEFLHHLIHRLLLIKNYFKKFMASVNQRQNRTYRCLLENAELDGIINFIGSASDKNNKILNLAYVYKDAGDACNMINIIFNFIITTSISSTFVFIISFFWASLNCLKRKGIPKTTNTMINIMFWTLAELFPVFTIPYYCDKVIRVKEEIKIILNKIIIDDRLPKGMRDQAKVFVEITEVWPLTIQAYNMFQINKNLILKFIGICTSYIIVVIQIE